MRACVCVCGRVCVCVCGRGLGCALGGVKVPRTDGLTQPNFHKPFSAAAAWTNILKTHVADAVARYRIVFICEGCRVYYAYIHSHIS